MQRIIAVLEKERKIDGSPVRTRRAGWFTGRTYTSCRSESDTLVERGRRAEWRRRASEGDVVAVLAYKAGSFRGGGEGGGRRRRGLRYAHTFSLNFRTRGDLYFILNLGWYFQILLSTLHSLSLSLTQLWCALFIWGCGGLNKIYVSNKLWSDNVFHCYCLILKVLQHLI